MFIITVVKIVIYFVCFGALLRRFQHSGRAICLTLIPPFFLDCVVAIGVLSPPIRLPDGKTKREIAWSASGFLYGEFIERVDEKQSRFIVYLITNRHVLDEVIANSNTTKDTIYLRFNPEAAEPARELELNLRNDKGMPLWFTHPCSDVDAAIVPLNANFLKEQGIKFSYFQNNKHVADRSKAVELGLSEGDGIYVLGFPMGIVGKERNFVIVRQGSIARIRDFLAGSTKDFLADAFVFPGNSGGPVVVRPEVVSIEGTKTPNTAYLIGMVKSYVPFQDVAISQQTKKPRILFEENSGLANIVSVDSINETIEEFKKPPSQRKPAC